MVAGENGADMHRRRFLERAAAGIGCVAALGTGIPAAAWGLAVRDRERRLADEIQMGRNRILVAYRANVRLFRITEMYRILADGIGRMVTATSPQDVFDSIEETLTDPAGLGLEVEVFRSGPVGASPPDASAPENDTFPIRAGNRARGRIAVRRWTGWERMMPVVRGQVERLAELAGTSIERMESGGQGQVPGNAS